MSIVVNSAFSFIEGYLLKKIDKNGLFKIKFYHLRYIRIVFQANVMIIKNDKGDNNISKEIPLSELIKVELICTKEPTLV